MNNSNNTTNNIKNTKVHIRPTQLSDLIAHLQQKVNEVSLNNQNPDLNLLKKLGKLHFRNASYTEAVKVFRKIYQIYPQDHSNTIDLALALLHTGNYDESKFLLEQVVDQNPKSLAALLALARYYEMTNDSYNHIKFLLLASNLDPSKIDIKLIAAETLRKNGDYQGAIRLYNEILQINPNIELARFSLAILLIKQQKYNDAINHLQELLKLNPTAFDAWYNLGLCFYLQKKWQLASNAFQKAIKKYSNYPQLYFFLGNCFYHLKDFDSAILFMERFVELQPNSHEAKLLLAKFYMQTHELHLAKELLEQLISSNPEYSEPFIRLAEIYINQRAFKKAETVLKQMFIHHPGHIEGHRLMGDLYFEQAKYKDAINEYKNTLFLNNKFLPSLHGLAKVYRQLNQINEEYQILKEILSLTPNDPLVLLRIGKIEKELGITSFIDRFIKVKNLCPSSAIEKEASYYLKHCLPKAA